MTRYNGRLELTWTNKDQRLLAHENGAYEWAPASDFRVSEVRLLHDVETVGECHPASQRSKDNLLIRGDALNALTSLIHLPEFAKTITGNVRLVYIDPPFNTGEIFPQYDDALEHSVWLTMFRDRLLQVKKLLAANGSVWVHLDDSEMHRARVVLDEVFGPNAFVTTIVWQKRTTRENRPAFSPAHDYILVYAPLGPQAWKHHRNKLSRSGTSYSNPDQDPKGPWTSIPFTAKGMRKNQMYTITTPAGVAYTPPFKNRCWSATEPEYRRLLAEGLVYFPRDGKGKPRIKQYPWEDEGLVPDTLWLASDVGTNDDAKKQIHELFPGEEEFATPKPEPLLRRIIEIGSDPGDLVLDFFLGSGTTTAVAMKTGRRWIGVERAIDTVHRYASPRLSMVAEGSDDTGVTEEAAWEGGGSFRVLDLAPSMFENDGGNVVLSEWVTNGKLAEVTAAQLGIDFKPDPPFSGRKGRSRLAVVDGLVNEPVIDALVRSLSPDERLVVCGTAIDPKARPFLRGLRPGSTLRKIPQSILEEYRQVRFTPSGERGKRG